MKKIISIFLLLASLAYSASFDCEQARTLTESAICNDAVLSEYDSKMAELYKQNKHKPGMVQEQRSWLKNVRNKQTTVKGLKRVYSDRIEELGESVDTVETLPKKQTREKRSENDNIKNKNSDSKSSIFKDEDWIAALQGDLVETDNGFFSTVDYDEPNMVSAKYRYCVESMKFDVYNLYEAQAKREGREKEFYLVRNRAKAFIHNYVNKGILQTWSDDPEFLHLCNEMMRAVFGP